MKEFILDNKLHRLEDRIMILNFNFEKSSKNFVINPNEIHTNKLLKAAILKHKKRIEYFFNNINKKNFPLKFPNESFIINPKFVLEYTVLYKKIIPPKKVFKGIKIDKEVEEISYRLIIEEEVILKLSPKNKIYIPKFVIGQGEITKKEYEKIMKD